MNAKKTKKRKPKKSRAKKAKKRTKKVAVIEASPEAPKPNGHTEWTSERIEALRGKLGLTQEQFAHRLGVTYVTVNRWENGRFSPKGLSLEALMRMEQEA